MEGHFIIAIPSIINPTQRRLITANLSLPIDIQSTSQIFTITFISLSCNCKRIT